MVAAEICRHTGAQTCPHCSWSRPREAALLFVRGRTARRALPVAVVVGTVLSLVNQGSLLFQGAATPSTWMRVGVNYAVPFIVASLGYLSGRRVRSSSTPWPRYLADFHDDRPGITELLLDPAVDRRQERPYSWVAEPLRARTDVILDLACGSAPTRDPLRGHRWIGVDVSAGELAAAMAAGRGPVAQARAERLPIGDDTVGAVCAAMCFPVVPQLEQVLAEVKRVLRPGGVLVALVPSRMVTGSGLAGWWRVMRALGLRTQPWPNPAARDGLPKVLRAQGFTVDSSRRRVFRRAMASSEDASLLINGLYLPDVGPERIAAARAALTCWARPGRRLPIPLRRVVAHLPGTG